MTSIKQQEVFEVRYVRGSKERCRILKACHVDLSPGHMGGKRTSHRDLEGYNISHFSLHMCFMYRFLPMTFVKGIARNSPLQYQNRSQSSWHHVGIDFVGPISPKSTSGNSYILIISQNG